MVVDVCEWDGIVGVVRVVEVVRGRGEFVVGGVVVGDVF